MGFATQPKSWLNIYAEPCFQVQSMASAGSAGPCSFGIETGNSVMPAARGIKPTNTVKNTCSKKSESITAAMLRRIESFNNEQRKEECMGKQKGEDDEKQWPKNLFKRGESWVVDFYFRGERYTETLGPMSKSTAQGKRDKRK